MGDSPAMKGSYQMNKVYEVVTPSGWVLFTHHSRAAALVDMWQATSRGHRDLTVIESKGWFK